MERQKNVIAILTLLVSAGLISGCIFVYRSFFASPVLKYNDDTGEFTVQQEFRGITMRVYPQMLIRIEDTVFQVTHLDGYLEKETIHFQERKAVVKKKNQEYCSKLQDHIREGILNEVETACGEKAAEEIDRCLVITVSFIGGVQYQVPLGNRIEKYCVIERSGLVVDYETDVEEIRQRLYESELTLGDDLDMIAIDPKAAEIIQVCAAEISRWYGNNRKSV